MYATARRTSWISLCSSRSLRGANIAGPCCLLEHSSPLWSKIIGLPTKSIRSYPNNIQPNSKHISSETTNLLAWVKETTTQYPLLRPLLRERLPGGETD